MTKRKELERKIALIRFTVVGGNAEGRLSSNETENLQQELLKLQKELSKCHE
jgi:hypothetical protein